MQVVDYVQNLDLIYDAYVQVLLAKYGAAPADYFREDSYQQFLAGERSLPVKNRITRTADGLYVHYIDEDKIIMISTPRSIKDYNIPYAYQRRDRLVYANEIEHAILHLLIATEHPHSVLQAAGTEHFAVGIGGYLAFLRPEMQAWLIDGVEPMLQWQQSIKQAVTMMPAAAQTLLAQLDAYLIANYLFTQVEIDEMTQQALQRK